MQSLQYTNLRIPGFVQEDYPIFAQFVKAYYEWLSTTVKRVDINKFRDIDETIDIFIEAFKQEYLTDFPKTYQGDVKLFLKHHLDFYKSKGSEESIRFLFRLLYNEEIDIQYPRDLIISPSEGTWNVMKSIKIQTNDVRVLESTGKYVMGVTTHSLAYVENIYSYIDNNVAVYELNVSNIKGSFSIENISITLTDGHIITGTIVPAVNQINVTAGGAGYKAGQYGTVVGGSLRCFVQEVERGGIDTVTIVNGGLNYTLNSIITLTDPTGQGLDANIQITSVSGLGAITGLAIINRGTGYKDFPLVLISIGSGAVLSFSSLNIGKIKSISIDNHGVYPAGGGLPTITFPGFGNGAATVVAQTGALCIYPGKYNTTKGFLSDVNKLQDGIKYQPYSYLIRSGQSLSQYQSLLKKLVHPAGMLQLGEIFIENLVIRSSHPINSLGPKGGNLLREIVATWESYVISSINLTSARDIVLVQTVSYTVPTKSNLIFGIDWLYKYKFRTRYINSFLTEKISDYTYNSTRAFAIVGTAVAGQFLVGYDKLRVPVQLSTGFIEQGNPGRAIGGYGVSGVAIVGSNSGRLTIQNQLGDVITDATKTIILADLECIKLKPSTVVWDNGLTTWDANATLFVDSISATLWDNGSTNWDSGATIFLG